MLIVMLMLLFLALEMSEVQQRILEVEADIKMASANILSSQSELLVKYWMKKEEDLRKKEEDLRAEKQALRKKEENLLKSMYGVSPKPDIQEGTLFLKFIAPPFLENIMASHHVKLYHTT